MRTKHIFSTLMLAAFAAACSNEELELVNNSNELAKGRFEIGQVELALGDGVDSRYAVGPNFNDLTAEAGDELGAALIDTWNGTTNDNDFKYDYSISDYIHTNYSFKYNGEKWASEAKMVEGNYFFYAPYNAAHVTRSAVTAKFNAVQQLAVKADGSIDELSTIKQLKESGEVMAVGYKFISREDGKTVSTSLLPIYAYPLITLKNNYEPVPVGATEGVPTDLVINQVVVSTTAGFPTEATFNFGSGTAIETTAGVVAELRDFTYWKDENHTAEALKGDFAKNNGAKDNFTADLLNTATKTTSAIVVKAPANYTLKAGATAKFHVVMPAAEYTSSLDIAVYTNKGVFNVMSDGTLAVAAGKRYGQDDYNADGTLKNDAEIPSGTTLSLDMNVGNCTGASASIVASAADLVTLIQNTKEATLAVQPLNEDVEINAAVMNAIKAKSAFALTVTAPATISTNLDSSNKTIEFQKGAIVKEGTITINNKVSFTDEILNVKGGTVTIAATFDGATLEVNDGDVTLKSDVETNVNGGKLTIGAETSVGAITNNGGTVTFVAGADKDHPKTYTNDVTNNKGTLTVPAWTTLSGTIVANGNVANETKATVNVEANGTVSHITENTAKGTINADGKVTIIETNNGPIVMGAAGNVEVTANNYRIDNTNNGTVNASGIIYYEFTEDVNGKLVVKSSKYNTIILNGMTWAPEAAQTLATGVNVIMKDATIEIWDEVTITIDGTLTTENSDNKKSYAKGVAGAVIESESGSSVAGLEVTGITLQ